MLSAVHVDDPVVVAELTIRTIFQAGILLEVIACFYMVNWFEVSKLLSGHHQRRGFE